MARHRKLRLKVDAGHHDFTGYHEAAVIEDGKYVRIQVRELLDWLEQIEITIEPTEVRVAIIPGDVNETAPILVRYNDGTLKLEV